MMKRLVSTTALLALVAAHGTIDAAVTGRVVDGSNNPVKDAMISYTDLDNRLIYTYSKADGSFALLAPSEWSIKSPGIYNPTSVLQRLRSEGRIAESSRFNMYSAGNIVCFNIEDESRVNIELFNVNGKKVATVFNDRLSRGTYAMDPFARLGRQLSAQVYMVRLSDGKYTQAEKVMYLPGVSRQGQLQVSHELQNSVALAKPVQIQAVDSIRVGKTNFSPAKKAIDGYSVSVGDVQIRARDIEAEVNAILNGKDRQWRANQVTQGVNGVTSAKYGTVYWDVGASRTHQERLNQFGTWQSAAVGGSGSGVPQLVGNDAVHGNISPSVGTIMPHNIGLGCSQNIEVVELGCRVVAIEANGMGVNWTFAPCMDVVRNERHGRTYEGWDEGPDGTIKYVRAAIRGFQGTDLSHPYSIAATAKHYAGAGGTTDGRHKADANTSNHAGLCRIHLPPFKAATEEGVASVMAAFNPWMGTKMHGHKVLLTDTLKVRWNWDGFVCGDWMEAQNAPGGVTGSFNAGMDNPMMPQNVNGTYEAALAADEARITDAARRILRVKARMNLMNDHAKKSYLTPTILSDLHKQVAREAAKRSLVLLKNENNVLPLQKSQKIHVVGAWADNIGRQCGGWTNGWQGTNAANFKPHGMTIREGINHVSGSTMSYSADANNIPADADVIVVAVGEDPYAEDAGDRMPPNTLQIPNDHQALVTACANSGKPVVCVLISGRPMIVTSEIEKSKAFVAAWLPGPEGGQAIAELLYAEGGENFSAKLSHTWPRHVSNIPINTGNYDDVTGDGGQPLFNYGFGLSY